MTDHAKKATFSFTQSFKSTVQRFDSLSDGKKADFSRSAKVGKPPSKPPSKPAREPKKVAS